MQGLSYIETQGSGILLGKGRHILTSGHSFDRGSAGGIQVTFVDGRSFSAKVVRSSFDEFGETNADLALLELATGEPLIGLAISHARVGEVVTLVGYPGKHGINSDGQVVHGQAYKNEPLEPLTVVAQVESVSPVVLRVVAGAIPTGGMSGSPVIDVDGRLVGIFNQVASTPERSGVWYELQASSSQEWPTEILDLGRD